MQKYIVTIMLFLISISVNGQRIFEEKICHNIPQLEIKDSIFIQSIDSIIFKQSDFKPEKDNKTIFYVDIKTDNEIVIIYTHRYDIYNSSEMGYIEIADFPFLIKGYIESFFIKKEEKHTICQSKKFFEDNKGNIRDLQYPYDPPIWVLSYNNYEMNVVETLFVNMKLPVLPKDKYPYLDRITLDD